MPDRAVAAVQKARGLSGSRPDIVAFQGYILARADRIRSDPRFPALLARVGLPD
jgi:hypothetical protein